MTSETKKDYTLKALLFTDVDKKKDPDKDEEDTMNLDEESQTTYKKY